MKQLLLTLFLIILVVALGLAVQNKYQITQNQKEHEARIESVVQQQADNERNLLREDFIDRQGLEIERLRVECAKGEQAYDLLTELTVTKATRPECAKVLVP